MATFYLILVLILFILAISDLIVGVSNDAVNFLNAAVGAKAATFRWIIGVAALGVLVGATFSSGMMEVARKGIFHPEYFYFSEIILLFLAVMVTDVILLDTFNTFGLPTSTTVSIVFELLGAAVAISIIKVYTDPNALFLHEYINSAKALAIISGILLSVVIAFTAGVIIQFISRLLFSFDYEKRLPLLGPLWGGLAIAAITYFILIKGSKGASFMDDAFKQTILDNTWLILGISFVGWTILLGLLNQIKKFDILKLVVLVGTFALAMAFAGNDLVNFIGVPLAGYNSYLLYAEGSTGAENMLMDGLAGQVPTPTFILLLAGLVMVATLITSKKAQSVVKTSLDLARQEEGTERFSSHVVSRKLVRNFSNMALFINRQLPDRWVQTIEHQFDEKPFIVAQRKLGEEAPSFDMIRASVTLVVASILISIGTNLKLPLSTTYVTFMVFMGASLADGAWGRESAVYRVSGVISVVGGWFFTAFAAFTVAFILALIFHFGGIIAIGLMLIVAAFFIYRTHKLHHKRLEDRKALETMVEEGSLTKDRAVDLCVKHLNKVLISMHANMDLTMKGLQDENLNVLNKALAQFNQVYEQTIRLKSNSSKTLAKMPESDLEAAHLYILVIDYTQEMAEIVHSFIKFSLDHVDNNHKPLLPVQIEELQDVNNDLLSRFQDTIHVFNERDAAIVTKLETTFTTFIKKVRSYRKRQIKRIKGREVGTRNSLLYLNLLAEQRNLMMFANRIVQVMKDMMIEPQDFTSINDPNEDAGIGGDN